MRPTTRLLSPACLLMLVIPSYSASADDAELMPPPAAAPTEPAPPLPSFTSPAPMGSSLGTGAMSNGGVSPPVKRDDVVKGQPAPAANHGWPPAGTTPLGSGPLDSHRVRRSDRESIDQFQSSAYWTAPRPFDPFGAPNYREGLAGAGGIHIRFPYFKYRAPWTYQGPAGISHTIVW